MKKFINKTDNFIVDSLRGFAKAHDDIVVLNLDPIFVTRK
jgi:dihydroxyacetone kinase-like protein